jgi:transcriptional regulator with XRE-family HTH domain
MDIKPQLQIAQPGETRLELGQWLRALRQQREMTQPMLASRSGVPVATLSRLEREGAGSLESMLRVLQALGELDGFHAELQERLRRVTLPRDLADLKRTTPKPRLRVRMRKPRQEGA